MSNTIKHNGNLIDLSNLSKEELAILKSEIENIIIDINNQIVEAKQKASGLHEYSDPHWFRSINDARKINIKKLDSVNIALSILRKNKIEDRNKKESGYYFSYYFQKAAKSHLRGEDYDYICKLAGLYRDDAVKKRN